MGNGLKFDAGKLRYDLVPAECEEALAMVLTHGAMIYGENNWQELDEFENRYYAAARRHLAAMRKGERIDPKSGLPHSAHVMCNAMFLLWKDLQHQQQEDAFLEDAVLLGDRHDYA